MPLLLQCCVILFCYCSCLFLNPQTDIKSHFFIFCTAGGSAEINDLVISGRIAHVLQASDEYFSVNTCHPHPVSSADEPCSLVIMKAFYLSLQ